MSIIIYIIQCNKLLPETQQFKATQILPYSLSGSGIWAQLGWVLYLNRLPSGVGQS